MQSLQDQLLAAHAEIDRITEEGRTLRRKVHNRIEEYASKYGCDPSSLWDIVEDQLVRLIEDARGPAVRRCYRIENEMNKLEAA